MQLIFLHVEKCARCTVTMKRSFFSTQSAKRSNIGSDDDPASSDETNSLSQSRNISRSRQPDGSKHASGYQNSWESDYTWVYFVPEEGMYCKLCKKFDTKNKQNQSRVWNTEPCITIRKDVLSRHESSAMHKEALEQERACRAVKARGGIAEAMQEQLLLSRKGAMKCLYWLCKQEIPHTTNYEPLLSLAKALGCSYLSTLNQGGNAHYTSERIIQEVVCILAGQIEQSQINAMSNSKYYGLMIDESTDVASLKQLVLYGRYVN